MFIVLTGTFFYKYIFYNKTFFMLNQAYGMLQKLKMVQDSIRVPHNPDFYI